MTSKAVFLTGIVVNVSTAPTAVFDVAVVVAVTVVVIFDTADVDTAVAGTVVVVVYVYVSTVVAVAVELLQLIGSSQTIHHRV